jgi:polyribonucleotide nucleotidyltransferase
MGLIKEGKKYAILSDIMGDEDHLGDMDFKVAGSAEGITALQMDIKINGINREIMSAALEQAKAGRTHILAEMLKTIDAPRQNVNSNAPKITTIQIDKEKIRELIGPGGKVIKDICEKSQAKIDIDDNGTVRIAASTSDKSDIALQMIHDIVAMPEVGKIYNGVVTKITDFGAFVKYLGNSEGLLHISEIADHKVEKVTDFFNEGDTIAVKLIGVERNGKVRLSIKALNGSANAEKPAHKVKESEDVSAEEAEQKPKKKKRPNDPRRGKEKRERPANEEKPQSQVEDSAVDSVNKKRRFF